MGRTTLRREVLPPRRAGRDPRALQPEVRVHDAQAAIVRAIWASAALTGLASFLARLLETWT